MTSVTQGLRLAALTLIIPDYDAAIGFFVDVYSHMPGMVAIEGEGGDLGSTGGTIIESIKAFKQMFGDSPELDEDTEALLRARFATYLREHGKG